MSAAEQTPESIGPLAGLRVLELAGPRTELCGKLLADMGAAVLLVEPPAGSTARRIGPFAGEIAGENRSLHFWYYNTSKRGVTLSLAHPDGRALWRRLVAGADVVIEAEPPGTLDELGSGHASFAAVQPGLIWVSITPFGQHGPYAAFKMTDLTSMAMGGPMASTGYDDEPGAPPIRPEANHSLHMAGVFAANAVMAALLDRRQGGAGIYLDLSIHEACACTTEGAFPNWEYHHRPVIRQTGRHSAPFPTPRWQFQCTDGRDINVIGGGIPRGAVLWKSLLTWMQQRGLLEDLEGPEFGAVTYTTAARGTEVTAHAAEVIGRFIESMPSEEAYRGGQGRHMPWGIVRTPDENLDDPHWHDRGFFVEVEHPEQGRSYTYPGLPYLLNGSPGRPRHRAPLLGEHTYAVYVQELGLTADELRPLFESGAI
jgi:crotonobetainyl-CoA:carnitine CoA-transferase CaiB-like acyl-CoA transferase